MPYVVTKASPRYRQLSVEDILFNDVSFGSGVAMCENDTVTRFYDHLPPAIASVSITPAIRSLQNFNQCYEQLFKADRRSLYHTYYIPKRSGGSRRIDEPLPELMQALRALKQIFEIRFHALYHTSAFAYVPRRCTVDMVKRHQQNESMWFAHYDFHNFFGSTTPTFLWSMLTKVWPFSEVIKDSVGRVELAKSLSLCFLDGGLPQGTPISPMLTNLMMIPFDHQMNNHIEAMDCRRYVYTRYADDITISSRSSFDYKKVEDEIVKVLRELRAPMTINEEKTHYGNRNGSNWMYGMMLNRQNEITVGWRNVEQFRLMLFQYLNDRKNGIAWPLEKLRSLSGTISYYKMVNEAQCNRIIDKYNALFQTSIKICLKQDIKTQERM